MSLTQKLILSILVSFLLVVSCNAAEVVQVPNATPIEDPPILLKTVVIKVSAYEGLTLNFPPIKLEPGERLVAMAPVLVVFDAHGNSILWNTPKPVPQTCPAGKTCPLK